ncbi:MAG: alpha/beta hydrolase [Anaerolineaceae bacterium]|nr:alpha/beta hydrolase [Anaerolineaceae bacterium]
MIFLYIILALFLILIGAGYYFSRQVIYPKTFPWKKTYEIEVENGKIDPQTYQSWEKEEIIIRSPNGYDLFGIYLPFPKSTQTVIISHGITFTLFGSVKYIKIFRNLGLNVLIYDLRNHGRSEGKNTTYGLYEKYDLKACVDWVFKRNGESGAVGTMGESMGAAISLEHAAIDPRIDFVIADCPFSDLTKILTYRLKQEYHLPPFPLIPLSNWFSKQLAGLNYKNVSPIEEVKSIKTPILFIHGMNDDYIQPEDSEAMFLAKIEGVKQLYLAPNAGHAQAYWLNQEEYTQKVQNFLREINFLH